MRHTVAQLQHTRHANLPIRPVHASAGFSAVGPFDQPGQMWHQPTLFIVCRSMQLWQVGCSLYSPTTAGTVRGLPFIRCVQCMRNTSMIGCAGSANSRMQSSPHSPTQPVHIPFLNGVQSPILLPQVEQDRPALKQGHITINQGWYPTKGIDLQGSNSFARTVGY